jgi:hypothetical protein
MIAAGWILRAGIDVAVRRMVRTLRLGDRNELVLPSVYESCRSVTGLRWAGPPLVSLPRSNPWTCRHVEAVKPFPEPSSWPAAWSTCSWPPACDRGSRHHATGGHRHDAGLTPLRQYRPHTHKTQHHGRARVVFLGPRAGPARRRSSTHRIPNGTCSHLQTPKRTATPPDDRNAGVR